jgi:hypothetical protein
VITLLGTILRELDGQILFRVDPDKGDAAVLRFPAASEFWIKRAQCHVREARTRGELDRLEMSAELASLKAQSIVMGGC